MLSLNFQQAAAPAPALESAPKEALLKPELSIPRRQFYESLSGTILKRAVELYTVIGKIMDTPLPEVALKTATHCLSAELEDKMPGAQKVELLCQIKREGKTQAARFLTARASYFSEENCEEFQVWLDEEERALHEALSQLSPGGQTAVQWVAFIEKPKSLEWIEINSDEAGAVCYGLLSKKRSHNPRKLSFLTKVQSLKSRHLLQEAAIQL
ncbi:MAG: hypothetical protein K0S07_1349 [Chlamydiales bacterium]|nr:hypothetical protein [Chlamydiales bacterium]